MTRWTSTSPTSLSISVLKRLLEDLDSVSRGNCDSWLFAIIDIDHALASLLVGALTQSNGTGALTSKLTERVLLFYSKILNYPNSILFENRTAEFEVLLYRAKSLQTFDGSQTLESIIDAKLTSITRIHHFRNDLIHVKPANWKIETEMLPALFRDSMDLISPLSETTRIRIKLEEEDQATMANTIHSVLSTLAKL
jgi:hypothetical protein